MQARPTTLVPNRSSLRPGYRRWVLWPLVVVAGLGLALAIGLRVVEGVAAARLAAIGARYGIGITAGNIELPLVGGISLHDVVVTNLPEQAGAPVVTLGRFDRITTDLTLMAAAGGKRRPEAISLEGGKVALRFDANGLVGMPRPRPDETPETAGVSGGGALRVDVKNLDASLSGSVDIQTLPADVAALLLRVLGEVADAEALPSNGPLILPELRLQAVAMQLVRDPGQPIATRGTAQLGQAGLRETSRLAFETTLDGHVKIALEQAFRVRMGTTAGDIWLGLQGLSSDNEGLSLAGLDAQMRDSVVRVGRVALLNPDMPSPTAAPRAWLSQLQQTMRVEIEQVELRHGSELAAAERVSVTRAAPIGPLPEPASVGVHGIRLVSAAYGTQLAMRVEGVEVAFNALLAKLQAGDPLGGIASVVVTRPEGNLVVPSNLFALAPGARPATPEDETPVVGDGGMPVMPNDDDALGGGRTVDDAAKRPSRGGFTALERLFDTFPTRLAAIDAMLGGKAGALAHTAARLRPEIRGGRLAIADTDGRAVLGLDEGALTLHPTEAGGLALAFESRLVRDGAEQGRFNVAVGVDAAGRLERASARVKGREVAARLAALVDHFAVQPDSEVDIDITWQRPLEPQAPHHLKGRFAFKRFSFEYWRISDREITDLEGLVDFDASLDPAGRRLLIDLPSIRVGQATLAASADIRKPKDLKPSVAFRMRMPRQDCGAAAASIPRSLIPNLSTLALKGEMQFDAQLNLDLEKPRELTLKVQGDVDSCEVLSLGPNIQPELLRGRFVHHPREPDRGVLDHIAVGRGTREWLESREIPDHVKLAAWTTEDRKWEEHGGVRWDLVASALKIDLDHGRFIYGGSTITQQLVKNLYLTRGKNLARKFEEMIIAWQMERVLEKDEILTIYINCIEYGPDIYGIRAAARHYFDKKPQQLDALEAAFIMGLKPYPKAGYRQWEKQELDYWWVRRVSYVLKLMAKYGPHIITPEEAEAFAPYQPVFRRPDGFGPR
jgi:hypothetical protein